MTVSPQSAQVAVDKKIVNFREKVTGRTGKFVLLPQIGLTSTAHIQRWNKFKIDCISIPNAYDGTNKDRAGVLFTDEYAAAILADGNSRDAAKVAEYIVRTAALELFRYLSLPTVNQTSEILFTAAEKLRIHAKVNGLDGATTASLVIVSKTGEYRFAKVGDSPIYEIKQGAVKYLGKEEQIMVNNQPQDANGMDVKLYFENDNQLTSAITTEYCPKQWIESGEGILMPKEAVLTVSDGLTKNMPVIIDKDGKIVDSSRVSEILEASRAGELDRILIRLYQIDNSRTSGINGMLTGLTLINGDLAYKLALDDKTGISIVREQ